MDLLSWVRKEIITILWTDFKKGLPQAQIVENKLKERREIPVLDHFAIIDIPSKETGIPVLQTIFGSLGFEKRGEGELPEKQNRFIWMAESDLENRSAVDALPQVVLSDFNFRELSFSLQNIVSKYAEQATPAPVEELKTLVARSKKGDEAAAHSLVEMVVSYIQNRNYPQVTKKDYDTVLHENELLASTLVHSRRVGHFGIGCHNLKTLLSLKEVNDFVMSQCKLDLNQQDGSYIKGTQEDGISQSSTVSEKAPIQLADYSTLVTSAYLEFVWRYPKIKSVNRPALWDEYFTGFVSQIANRVIERIGIPYFHE